MEFANIEYWVLKSMQEAQASLEHGEVPVGCLFIIQQDKLNEIVGKGDKNPEEIGDKSQESHSQEIQASTSSNPIGEIHGTNSNQEMLTFETCDSNQGMFEKSIRSHVRPNTEFEILASSSTTQSTGEMHETCVFNPRIPLPTGTEHSQVTEMETKHYLTPGDGSGGYTVIARGKNQVNATKNATRHAELVCIDHIVAVFSRVHAKVFANMTVIVNVEPCIMCMAALLELNVRTIVFTCVNDRFGFNILGDASRTNYVEIVEVDSETPSLVNSEMAEMESRKPDLVVDSDDQSRSNNNASNIGNDPVELHDDVEMQEMVNTYERKSIEIIRVELMNKSEDKTEGTEKTTDLLSKNLENVTDMKSQKHLNLNEQNKVKKYKVSFMNKELLASQHELISDKISSLVSGERMTKCNVLHYRKYEADTMDILKLFYKGINPNAPKHKVKIKNSS